MTTTEAGGLANLPAALNVAAFELLPDGLFRPIGALPDWFHAHTGQDIDLADRYPVLELFLQDCQSVFEDGAPPSLESDVWEEHEPDGSPRHLQATAFRLGGRRVLAIRLLPLERLTYQQLCHNYQLAEEEANRLKLVAERATRAKSDFLATMSHEIRTPLNAVIGMADVLSSTDLTPEQKRCVEVLQRNGIGLLNLINDILDLSKVESGKVELEAVPFDVREVISRAVEVVDGRARDRGLTILRHLAPDVPVRLMGDPNRLRQVLINLLGNSLKFTERGHLEVRVEQDPEDPRPGCLRLAVSDTGVGIPEDKLGLIFESFTQADSSTTRKFGGTGLGLTISRQLIELMGGRIWVKSQIGRGSTFFFTVKLAVHDDQSEQMPARETPSPLNALQHQAGGLRILLADDSDDNRFLIVSYLKGERCFIEIAEDGNQALDKFRAGRFNIVLMDVEMPVMDGYTATREIRRYEQASGLPPTPVLALTAHAFADMAERSREAGFTAHLTKPIRKHTLLQAIGSYAGQASAVADPAPPPAPDERSTNYLVRVEPGMEDVVPGYLEKRRTDVQRYREALTTADFAAVRMLGHKMKGTGAGYGFPVLTELGDAIEQAALRQDAATVSDRVDKLSIYLENVQLQFGPAAS